MVLTTVQFFIVRSRVQLFDSMRSKVLLCRKAWVGVFPFDFAPAGHVLLVLSCMTELGHSFSLNRIIADVWLGWVVKDSNVPNMAYPGPPWPRATTAPPFLQAGHAGAQPLRQRLKLRVTQAHPTWAVQPQEVQALGNVGIAITWQVYSSAQSVHWAVQIPPGCLRLDIS